MRELLRTNDAILLSDIAALLDSAAVNYSVFDRNVSAVEGSIGAFPRRVVVAEKDAAVARQLLEAAGFGQDLSCDQE